MIAIEITYLAGLIPAKYAMVKEERTSIDIVVCDLYDEALNVIAVDRVFFYRGTKKDIPFKYTGGQDA